MGDWSITITGSGQHHNASDNDADILTDKFVAALLEAGQRVRHAEFVSGGSLGFALRRVPLPSQHGEER